MDPLTPPQRRALDYIADSLDGQGSSPTLREICEFMGYSAIGSAQDVIASLRKKGYLKTPEKQTARGFQLTSQARGWLFQTVAEDVIDAVTIPCLGSVPAGNPVTAVEAHIGQISMATSQLGLSRPKRESLFALQAVGLSMRNAGILDGDWLIVNSQESAEVGRVVVARLEEDATVKRLMKDDARGFYLKPENEDFQNIYADESPFQVIGQVVALQRTIQ